MSFNSVKRGLSKSVSELVFSGYIFFLYHKVWKINASAKIKPLVIFSTLVSQEFSALRQIFHQFLSLYSFCFIYWGSLTDFYNGLNHRLLKEITGSPEGRHYRMLRSFGPVIVTWLTVTDLFCKMKQKLNWNTHTKKSKCFINPAICKADLLC